MAGNTNAFDVVIVGGGTAGLVIASRLSEDPEVQVLVLEAGQDPSQLPPQLQQAVSTPAAYSQLWKSPLAWDLNTVPQDSLNGRSINFPQGKMLGGSSGLNGLSFTAGVKAVVDGCAELGNPGWGWSEFSQALGQAYTLAKSPSPVSARNGAQGPLKVSYADDYADGWPRTWANTIAALGFPGAQDTLADQGPGGLMIPDAVDPGMGVRSYAGNAYLSPKVRERTNLTVRAGVEVHQVILKRPDTSHGNAIAEGVNYTDSWTGETITVVARREVIITAGVFGSPKLLELSGVGDPERLGLESTIVKLPGVGENLQNHPMTSLSFEVAEDAPATKDAFLRAAIRQDPQVLGPAMMEYMQHHTGMFASSGVTSAAQLPLPETGKPEWSQQVEEILKSSPAASINRDGFGKAHENYVRSLLSSPSEASGYYIFGPAWAAFNPDGTSALPPMDNEAEESYITILLMLAHPLSRGSVHVTGKGAEQELAIDPAYLSHPLDLEVMARHLQLIEKDLVTTEPLAKQLKPNGKRAAGNPEAGALQDLDVAKKFLKEHAVGAHHFTGSCSMMPRELGGVVDPLLRVYGTANLR
ncbi:hypothetical protein diail_5929 [Diaporthe ilicicola]|nr:hypothetical protein diail_5929 [Diaporthe ilicicola]